MIARKKDRKPRTPEQEERLKRNIAFMKNLQDEGKLVENFEQLQKDTLGKFPDWCSLVK